MIKESLTKEIIKNIIIVVILIIATSSLTYLILSNILDSKTTSFYQDNGLMIEIQEVIDKEITTELDNDNRKVIVTNNSNEDLTYQILMSSNSNLDDLLIRVDNRIRNISYLNKIGDSYIIGEYDLVSNATNQTIVNVYLSKGNPRKVKIKLKVIKKGDNNE